MDGPAPTEHERRSAADEADAALRPVGDWLALSQAVLWPLIAVTRSTEHGLDVLTWAYAVISIGMGMQAGARWALRLRRSRRARWLYRNLEWRAGDVHALALARATRARREGIGDLAD